MIGLSLAILVVMLVVMGVGWLFQRAWGNGGWTDVFWTYGTGAACAVAAIVPIDGHLPPWRHYLVAILVAAWSIRLGTYVAIRVARGSEDVRYAAMRHDWGDAFQRRMFGLLIVQAPVSCLLGVAVLFAAHQPDMEFRFIDIFGVLIFLAAITGETIADRQMQRFKADAANHGRVCDQGLWAWSRHPNYFFEALVWLTYPILGLTIANSWSLLSLLAPALMFVVVRFLTGVPPLEAAMVRSKGDAYRHYQQTVSGLLPWPPNRDKARD